MKLNKILLISLIIFCILLILYHFPFKGTAILIFLLCLYLFLKKTELGVAFFLIAIPVLHKLLILLFSTRVNTFYPLFFIIGLIIYIYYNFTYGEKINFKIRIFDILLIIFIFYYIMSVAFISTNKAYGIEKLIILVECILLSYTLFVITYKYSINIFIYALIIYGIFLSLFSLYELLGFSIPLFHNIHKGRYSFLGLNPIYLARDVSVCILANLFLITKLTRKKNSYYFVTIGLVLLTFFEIYTVFLTASRGPLLALMISIMIYFILIGKLKIKTVIYFILLFLFIAVIAVVIIPQEFMERILSQNSSGQRTIILRYIGNMVAIKEFWAHKIFGIGFGDYKFTFPQIETLVYPHNIFTEILAEGGILGILPFLLLIAVTVLKYLKKIKTDNNIFAFLTAFFIGALVNANISGHIGKNIYFWLGIFIIYGVYLRNIKEQEINTR